MREPPKALVLSPSRPLHVAVAFAVLGTLIIGIYPQWFLKLAQASVIGLLQ
jgi:NADH:ubiquinone oxidoreductase subunit 2 (subunit N)